MKKIFCILLAVMLLSIFTACGCSTDANVDGNSGNNGSNGENSRMYNDGIIDGDNERTNDGSSVQGGASAEFEIGGGNGGNGSGNGGSGNSGNSGSGSSNGSGRTASFDKGELSQLASLIGADDFKVIEKIGEGEPEAAISGNITIIKRRTYNLPVFGNNQTVAVRYNKDGVVDRIEMSPPYAPILWSMNISKEYGIANTVSTDGLDYDYYSVWRSKKQKIELICRNDKMTVQITKA